MSATPPHKRLRRGGSLALLLLLAALSFGLEFHHHKDGNTRDDCALCIVLHQSQAASLTSNVAYSHVLPVISDRFQLPEEKPSSSAPFRIPYIRPPPTHQ
jgi:hypothetical protein